MYNLGKNIQSDAKILRVFEKSFTPSVRLRRLKVKTKIVRRNIQKSPKLFDINNDT